MLLLIKLLGSQFFKTKHKSFLFPVLLSASILTLLCPMQTQTYKKLVELKDTLIIDNASWLSMDKQGRLYFTRGEDLWQYIP